MKIIALPDLHGKSNELKKIARPLHEADIVLLPGDITNGSMEEAVRIFNSIEKFNENYLTIPGNMDTHQFVSYTAHEGINLHRRHLVFEDFAVVGVGGALPFAGKFVFSEEQLASLLLDAISELPKAMPFILLCHQPPYATKVDFLDHGEHVGSLSVRQFIEEYQPLICFSGHIHEAQGIDVIGKTQIINPGPLVNGNYAYAEIEMGEVKVLEIRSY